MKGDTRRNSAHIPAKCGAPTSILPSSPSTITTRATLDMTIMTTALVAMGRSMANNTKTQDMRGVLPQIKDILPRDLEGVALQ